VHYSPITKADADFDETRQGEPEIIFGQFQAPSNTPERFYSAAVRFSRVKVVLKASTQGRMIPRSRWLVKTVTQRPSLPVRHPPDDVTPKPAS
jgi:hypothetical protein